MADIFKVKGTVSLDASDFHRSVDDAVSEGKRMADSIDGHSSSIHGALQNAFSFAGGQLISDGLREAWDFIEQLASESIGLASDLQEVQNVVDVTFGSGATEINTWSKAAQNAFGMSELKAKKYSSTMGAMLKSMGLTGDEVLDMSQNLTQLAGDMASFYNLDHEEAFDKIRSGISGETEPLKQLGINMSVVNLEAFAMAKGITKSYDAMTQAEQAMLRYNFLLGSTADAQGDFSRTSDSYANEIKLLETNLESLKTELGDWLLGIVTPAVSTVNEMLEELRYQNPDAAYQAELQEAQGTADDAYGMVGALEQLATKTSKTETEAELWNRTLQELVKTIPELTSLINLNTGEIIGGTGAIRDYLQAWEDTAENRAKANYVKSYQDTYDAAQSEQFNAQFNLIVAQNKYDNLWSELDMKMREGARQLGWSGEYSVDLWPEIMDMALRNYPELGREISDLNDRTIAARSQMELYSVEVERTATNAENAATNLESAKVAVGYSTDATDEATTAITEYEKALANQETALANVKTKADELTAAYQELKKAALEQVRSVVSGFREMDTSSVMSYTDLKKALESQTTYMEQYEENLSEVIAMGLNEGLVAQLSDGSEESAAILRGLTQTSGDEADVMVAELNAAWAANQTAMDEMAGTMATAQAEVDENVQTLKGQLETLIEEANMQDDARTAMKSTMGGLIDGLASREGELIGEAQSIVSNLESVFNSMSIGIRVGGMTFGGLNAGSNAKGLGYVPYNDYLTYLHKGEAVLNSVEAERYRAGQMAQPAAIDYDRLASSIASTLSGAIVQMDGQTVGELVAPSVSRSIQRESWSGRYRG